jgi:hypothetical protein
MSGKEILISSLEAISRANGDLSNYLMNSVKGAEAEIQAAVLAEREACAKIAETPNMSQSDIARAIRSR